MVGADGVMEPPIPTRDYIVCALGDRLIQLDGKRDWRMGVWLGPCVSGEGQNNAL